MREGELPSLLVLRAGQRHVKALIVGPGVFICNRCIGRVGKVLSASSRRVSTPIAIIAAGECRGPRAAL